MKWSVEWFGEDEMEFPTNIKQEVGDNAAEKLAEYYYHFMEGFADNFPIKITIIDNNGEHFTYQVSMDISPKFIACEKR